MEGRVQILKKKTGIRLKKKDYIILPRPIHCIDLNYLFGISGQKLPLEPISCIDL